MSYLDIIVLIRINAIHVDANGNLIRGKVDEVTRKIFCKRRFFMNKMAIEKANKLIRSQQCLNDLRQIVIYPYPEMFSKRKHDQKTGFCYNGDYVSFAHLDDVTKDKLKAAILTVIDDRYNELNDEIDKL